MDQQVRPIWVECGLLEPPFVLLRRYDKTVCGIPSVKWPLRQTVTEP